MTLQDAFIAPGELRKLLRYDPQTGRLYWLPRTPADFTATETQSPERQCRWFNTRYAGKEALSYTNPRGYRRGRIGQFSILAHRAVWALAYGSWPEQIDHINGDAGDNRLANLRSVSVAENARNRKRSATNRSGVVGVRWNPRECRWVAAIGSRENRAHLGGFVKFEDAVAARKAAELSHGYHPNHGSRG